MAASRPCHSVLSRVSIYILTPRSDFRGGVCAVLIVVGGATPTPSSPSLLAAGSGKDLVAQSLLGCLMGFGPATGELVPPPPSGSAPPAIADLSLPEEAVGRLRALLRGHRMVRCLGCYCRIGYACGVVW